MDVGRGPIRAVRVRRNPILRAFSGLTALGAVLSVVAVPFTNSAEIIVPTSLASLFGTLALVLVPTWLGWHYARREHVHLEVRHGGLSKNGEVTKAWSDGEATPIPDGRAHVDVSSWPRSERYEVDDLATARALLGALGLDRRAGTSRFYPRLHAGPRLAIPLAGVLFVGSFLAMALVGPLVAIACTAVAIAMCLVALWQWLAAHAEITIGTDGLEWRRRISARRFVPHARITKIVRVGSNGHPWIASDPNVSLGFRVFTGDGETVTFDTRAERIRGGVWKTDPIFDAVMDAWTKAAKTKPASTTLLARGERTVRDWITMLRGRSERAEYRVAAVDDEMLFDVLANPSAPRESRVAAAVALAANEAEAPRLRFAADDIADQTVRRVAVAALAHEEAVLEAAIDEATARASTRS